ncbi:PLP-dependent aminotransferase family protein [Streptomyces sp. NP160]|uniref:aminotransferase-like domain-containing protein n=1 Tax=Streptomyces sp. NP160 TaxID=2586637 RepID=UPI00214C2079|nr:PLP-dependent aminotransferase family protein [Streptomyces sp. NP160]
MDTTDTPGRSPGADLLQLDRAAAPPRGTGEWLAAHLRAAVLDGRLARGALLPSTRVLAADLGVSRGVVVGAYARLVDEGLLTGRAGAGTRVAAGLVAPVRVPREAPATGPGFHRPVGGPPASVEGASVLDLWPGVPDLSAFPRTAWLRAEREVLSAASARDLGYPDPRGHPVLREQLVGWLARTRGVRAAPDEVLVVSGVAQALALTAQVLVARGHRSAAVEDPGSRGAREELAHWGLRGVGVPVDAGGLDVEALAASGPDGPRVAVLTPAHQYPTGVVLSPERRRSLLAWCQAQPGRLVVEDDYDAEHRYDRPPVPALQASAPDVVLHTGSTSKSLAPALRLGWLVAPEHLRSDLLAAKHASDIASPSLPQLVLARLLAGGDLDRHLRRVRSSARPPRRAAGGAARAPAGRARARGGRWSAPARDAGGDGVGGARRRRGGRRLRTRRRARAAAGDAPAAPRARGPGARVRGRATGCAGGGRPAARGRPALRRRGWRAGLTAGGAALAVGGARGAPCAPAAAGASAAAPRARRASGGGRPRTPSRPPRRRG